MDARTRRWLAVALIVVAASACSRRVQAESEPARSEAAAAPIDMVGLYDYVVPLDNGDDAVGTMTVTRAGDGYAVAWTSNIGDVTSSNVRRMGDTLLMDVLTPNGAGTVEVSWQTRDRATGSVFLGDMLEMIVTRRP